MFDDEGIRSQNQIQGVDEQGNLRNVRVDSNGDLLVSSTEQKIVKTIAVDVITVGIDTISIDVNKYLSKIEVANYSSTAKLTVNINDKSFTIGSNIAVDIIIDSYVTSIEFASTEENTGVQYLLEGVE